MLSSLTEKTHPYTALLDTGIDPQTAGTLKAENEQEQSPLHGCSNVFLGLLVLSNKGITPGCVLVLLPEMGESKTRPADTGDETADPGDEATDTGDESEDEEDEIVNVGENGGLSITVTYKTS